MKTASLKIHTKEACIFFDKNSRPLNLFHIFGCLVDFQDPSTHSWGGVMICVGLTLTRSEGMGARKKPKKPTHLGRNIINNICGVSDCFKDREVFVWS